MLDMTNKEIIARTLWGEARGQGIEGMTAVANVIANRASAPTWWGHSFQEVCLKPFQFSCWNHDDPNRAKLLAVTSDDDQFTLALEIAARVLMEALTDTTNGAHYYHAANMKKYPSWALNRIPCAIIMGMRFYE